MPKVLRRPRADESRKAMLEAWRKFAFPGTPIDEAIPEPDKTFTRAWDRAIDWYRNQRKHAA